MLHEHFEVAAGSIAGRDHVRAGRNNQDALAVVVSAEAVVAVVCDGCGSGRASELGARAGARLVAEAIRGVVQGDVPAGDPRFWARVRHQLLARLAALAEAMGGDLARTVHDHFLFTVVAAVVTREVTAVAAVGDGAFALDGELRALGPFADNAPPYPGYALLDAAAPATRFAIHHVVPTDAVRSLLVATDGIADVARCAQRPLPGTDRPLGPIAQFWTEDRYFANPDLVRRRLAMANREVTRPDWERRRVVVHPGLLPDDTTLVAIRRRGGSTR